jgi:hypothetical protein
MALSVRPAIVIGAAALVLVTSPAVGRPDVGRPPTVSGPLKLESHKCYPPDKSIAEDGEVGLVTRSCEWLYKYPRDEESDGARDYGVAWVQTWFSPRNGWCLQRAESGIRNSSTHVVKRTPGRGFTVGRKHSKKTRLIVSAGGHASENASIEQSNTMYPGRVSTGKEEKGRLYKTTWVGTTKKTVSFAVGIEVWWNERDQSGTAATGILQSKVKERC